MKGIGMSFLITKASGDQEEFNIRKFRNSLKRAGASDALIDELAQKLETMSQVRTTRQIYDFAFDALQEANPPLAARYNIKRAIMDLGPAGFPFEQFIAKLYERQGYTTTTDYIAQGVCVTHEIDVIATKNEKHMMIECKFHNRPGLKVDIQVGLYVKARFDDLTQQTKIKTSFKQVTIATNTKFTTQVIAYAECIGLQLLGWSYPQENNIPHLIDQLHLHPITALTCLSSSQKRTCIKNGLVLCNDAPKHVSLFKHLGFSDQQTENIIKECKQICEPHLL